MTHVTTYFQEYLNTQSLFANKKVLQSHYIPDQITHREEQIQTIAKILAPGLRLERPSNIFVYGKTGSGKTVTVRHTLSSMQEVAQKNSVPLKLCYLNCKLKKVSDTEYRIIAELTRMFNKMVPFTGLPTDEVYRMFFNAVDTQPQVVVLVLDEIDQLVKKIGDGIIYNLTRINADLKRAQLCIIGISNDLIFSNTLDPRVKSSLSEEEIVFPPYNAVQLQQILKNRAHDAFRTGCLDTGVVEKCAAYAAREHGDARRALELLRVAGEIAERERSSTVTITHIDQAEEKLEKDRIVDIIKTQPKQFHTTLQAILLLCSTRKSVFTGDVYDVYKKVCKHTGQRSLTQRRISDIIAEMDMLGIINAKVISKGRFGRMREICLGLTDALIPKVSGIVLTELGLQDATFVREELSQERLV